MAARQPRLRPSPHRNSRRAHPALGSLGDPPQSDEGLNAADSLSDFCATVSARHEPPQKTLSHRHSPPGGGCSISSLVHVWTSRQRRSRAKPVPTTPPLPSSPPSATSTPLLNLAPHGENGDEPVTGSDCVNKMGIEGRGETKRGMTEVDHVRAFRYRSERVQNMMWLLDLLRDLCRSIQQTGQRSMGIGKNFT